MRDNLYIWNGNLVVLLRQTTANEALIKIIKSNNYKINTIREVYINELKKVEKTKPKFSDKIENPCPTCGTPDFLDGIECPGCGFKESFSFKKFLKKK